MKRHEVIERVLRLHAFTTDEYNRIGFGGMTPSEIKPQLTCEWFGRKPDRFYIVEQSSHREEDFSTRVCVHYGIRSIERNTISNGYGNSIETYPMELKHVYDMTLDEAMDDIRAGFDEYVKKREEIS
jgi:hypothetical protein